MGGGPVGGGGLGLIHQALKDIIETYENTFKSLTTTTTIIITKIKKNYLQFGVHSGQLDNEADDQAS